MKKYRLPKEFATKWLEALRSGKYKQTTSFLHDSQGYCCLGVAAKIKGVDLNAFGSWGYLENHMADFPEELFDVVDTNGEPKLQNELTKLNDNEHYSFTEIADWIEENVELY